MKNLLRLCIAAIIAMALTACSGTPDVKTPSADFVKITNGILTSSYGKTMYTFDKDQTGSGKSECVSTCADNWPPVYVEPGIKISGDFSSITRNDGQKQLTYKGKPLYFFAKDKNPGDKTGDNVNNVWHVVTP
jgi:predicted lipoprotein with Yx(FWY)xxD motif